MDCKETQRCIALFRKDELYNDTAFSFAEHVYACKECMEELTIEYLLVEGMNRLENADDIDVKSELEEKLNRIITRRRIYGRIKAGLFLVALMLICIAFLG